MGKVGPMCLYEGYQLLRSMSKQHVKACAVRNSSPPKFRYLSQGRRPDRGLRYPHKGLIVAGPNVPKCRSFCVNVSDSGVILTVVHHMNGAGVSLKSLGVNKVPFASVNNFGCKFVTIRV